MSLGYKGACKKELEDDELAVYSYSGENWNDGGKSKNGDSLLYDGSFIIYKECLEEPEIHTKTKKLLSSRNRAIDKRIIHFPDIHKCIENGKIVIEKECKNAFKKYRNASFDYIAYILLIQIFEKYQLEGCLVEKAGFVQ